MFTSPLRYTTPLRRLALIVIVSLMVFAVQTGNAQAAPPNPVLGVANVDGNSAEWNLANDYFAPLYHAARPDRTEFASLYLRYSCATQTLYALVLPANSATILQLADDAFVKLGNSNTLVNGNSGDNGVAPDFAWISPNGTTTGGWEASALLPQANYNNLNVHVQVNDAGGEQQTAAVANRSISLNINCQLAVTLESFEANPSGATMNVTWETVSEADNLGFNLLRANDPAATPVQLNGALIPSQSSGGGGASYLYTDVNVAEGTTYYYWLETVSTTGTTERYGPVSNTMPAPTAVEQVTFTAQPTPAPFGWLAAGLLLMAGAGVVALRRRV